ncbi:ABC-type transport system involved in multi-copper enzyme maturation permease subunit [Defluviitalea raffinosedens]|nr:ABC-type transport system involved in multi-copper enzyme maturation permease subunit [Defluviitalea raffinosedens]HHW68082.1 ABC transporter permease [Candidatus Epulonipiscium sp.]
MIMINPVLRRELKTKMRTWKAPTLLVIYLAILAVFGGLILSINELESYTGGFDPGNALTIYFLLAGCQLGLIIILVPALTSGTISGERERQTLDLLLITKLSPFSIIIGKLMASISQIILLILASMPVFSIIFLFGGVSASNILLLFFFFIATAVMVGSIGIFCSTFFRKTTTATVVSYLLILILSIGTLVGLALLNQYAYIVRQQGLTYGESLLIAGANPFVGFLSVIQNQAGYNIVSDILGVRNNISKIPFQPWQVNMIFDAIITCIMIFFSVIRIRPVMRRRK